LPSWFREGFAVMAAGQIEDKKYEALSFRTPEALALLLDSKANGLDTEKEYYAVGISVQILFEKFGAEGFAKLLKKIKEGVSFAEALKVILPAGQNETLFYIWLQRQTLLKIKQDSPIEEQTKYVAALEAIVPGGAKKFEKGERVYGIAVDILSQASPRRDSFLLDKAKEVLELFLKKYPESPYTLAVHYLLGLVCLRQQQATEASFHFDEVSRYPGRFVTFADSALFLKVSNSTTAKEDINKVGKLLIDTEVRRWAYEEWQKRKN
jgi:hypothetical protein